MIFPIAHSIVPIVFRGNKGDKVNRFLFRLVIVSGVACLALLDSQVAYAADEPLDVKIGLVQGLFRDVQPVMMKAMAKPFREVMAKQTGCDCDVEICTDALCLAQQLKDKKLHLGVFHGFEFAWAQKKCPELVPLIITIPHSRKVQAYIVVHTDSELKKLSDLEGEVVMIPRGAKSHSLAFLEKARDGFAKNIATPKTDTKLTTEDCLNGVVRGEIVAALVDSASLEGYQALQPGAFKQLKMLRQSEAFPAAVVAYHKDVLTAQQAQAIRTGMLDAHKNTTGKMLMMMWNLKGFEEAPATYQNELDAILKSYPVPEKTPLDKQSKITVPK